MTRVHKYKTWRAFDMSIGADAAASQDVFTGEVEEDLTIVSVRVHLKFMTDSDPAEGIGGVVGLIVVPRNIGTNGFGTATDENWIRNSTADSMNDAEVEHWAEAPFAVCGRHNDEVLLTPATKRVLRKGETLAVALRAQNFTNASQFLKICATIQVMTLEQ